jgi:steroid delta-isomerase-like uncharacterized protein
MSTDNKAVIRRHIEEIFNKGNAAAIDEFIAPTFVMRAVSPEFPELKGREGFKEFFTATRTGFPDSQWTVEDMVAEGDKVAAHWTFRGTHRGDYIGIAPTGKHVVVTVTTFYRIADGKIEEIWGDADALGLMQQLGGVPQLG